MGTLSIVHGRILLKGNYAKSIHFIRNLKDDKFPWIRAEMFSIGTFKTPYFYEHPVIAFAATYKAVEYDWTAFVIQLEYILKNIEFVSAKFQLETEFYGNYHFFWLSKSESDFPPEDMIETDQWFFCFGNRSQFGGWKNRKLKEIFLI